MKFEDFQKSLEMDHPPEALSQELTALWLEAKGNWDTAHEIIQRLPGADASWVHAYLHRKEPDNGNASYWYHKAGKKRTAIPHHEEWKMISQSLLEKRKTLL